jgi:hypothetical protein
MGHSHTPFFTATAIAGLVLMASLGNPRAQIPEPPIAEPPIPDAASPTPPEAAQLQESKLDQYADAYLAIQEIHAKASEQLENTDGAAAEYQIKSNAERATIEAVERAGLKLQEFNQITELMTSDPGLRAKIMARVEKRRRI